MNTYWAMIRNEAGQPLRVTTQADNAFLAYQQMVASYGRDRMISEAANQVPNGNGTGLTQLFPG